jgi:DNA-binding LacI/PurR family transcriptional regulator
MADIARMAGVSVSTVSRALADNPLIPEEKRREIQALAQVHSYSVNQFARNLRLGHSRTIAVVFPLGHEVGQLISDPFFLELLGRLADEITARGFDLLLTKVPAPNAHWLDTLIQSQRMDGIVIIGQSDQHEILNRAAESYLPMVVWGAHMPNQTYCTVGVDNLGGAKLAVDHLVKIGRKRIAFLGMPDVPEIELRRKGYDAVLKKARLPHGPDLNVPAHLVPDSAYDATCALIQSGVQFDAIFAASDVIAIAAIKALAASGRSVPEDVAVVGFDDISLAGLSSPPLTTVRQDLERGAQALVDLLFRRMVGEETPSATMPAELIVRRSCGGGA